MEEEEARRLAKEVAKFDEVLGVEIVTKDGRVLARASSKLELGPEWLEVDGVLPSVAWGAISRVEPIFGQAQMIVVEYEEAKLVGFRVGKEGEGAVVAISPATDPSSFQAKVLETIRW